MTDGKECLAIEYDGPQHFNTDGSYVEEDIQRHLTLKRAGWDIYRIPYDKWETEKSTCLNEVLSYFESKLKRAS